MKGISCLAGGVGAARFLLGLREVVREEDLTVIVNTGDDDEFHGLRVCPDLDIVSYTLAGLVDSTRGWGIKDDSFDCLSLLEAYGSPAWFRIGDRDFATHILRTQLLKQGFSLTETTHRITAKLGIHCRILPMSNSTVRTSVKTQKGWLSFQEYFVKERSRPKVLQIRFNGAAEAKPSQEVKSAIKGSEGIIICPSNPIVSIGPMLDLNGMRESLKARRDVVVAISPIVEGKTLKGPADEMMKSLGYGSSAYSVAVLYKEIAGTMIIDERDRDLKGKIQQLGMRCVATDTIMRNQQTSARLAEIAIQSLGLVA